MRFILEGVEAEKAGKFITEHECPITYEGAIGGKISYTFGPTSIGVTIVVKCACGKEENVTDYSVW